MVDAANQPPEERPKLKRKVEPRSSIWEHYTRLPNDVAMCNYCGYEIGCNSKKSGTSPMIGHNGRCKVFQDLNDQEKSCVIGKDSNGNMVNVKYDPELFRKSLTRLIVLTELPFTFVESEGFRNFCADVLPLYKTVSRRTACRDIVSMFMEKKASLKSLLMGSNQRVSLTTDIWTAATTSVNYMVVTAHWIDCYWQMQKKIIGFKPITDHRGETIAKQLIDCLDDWGLDKVFSITVDNARANDRAISVFTQLFSAKGPEALVQGGAFLHIRCCAHILNLVVKDGLATVAEGVVAIRNCIKYVRSSYARLQSFQMRCEGKFTRGQLTLDCQTRWNSTYLMLMSALKLRTAFERMAAEDKLFCEYFEETEDGQKRVGPPKDTDWEAVGVLVKFLKIFYKSTIVFSASKTVTSTLAYNEIVTMERNLLTRSFAADDEATRMQAQRMREKFDRYWDGLINMNPLVIIGSIFDPRNKMVFCELCFEKLYGEDSPDFRMIKSLVTNTLRNLFNEYNLKFGSASRSDSVDVGSGSSSSGGSQSRSGLVQLSDEEDDEYERMDTIYTSILDLRSNDTSATELDIYLMEKTEDRTPNALGLEFDVLRWWRNNAPKFPVLSQLARDVLAVQMTSVASESAFSTSGRILDPYRSSLTPFMVEVLVCSQQWLRSSQESARLLNLVQMREENEFFESLEPVREDGV